MFANIFVLDYFFVEKWYLRYGEEVDGVGVALDVVACCFWCEWLESGQNDRRIKAMATLLFSGRKESSSHETKRGNFVIEGHLHHTVVHVLFYCCICLRKKLLRQVHTIKAKFSILFLDDFFLWSVQDLLENVKFVFTTGLFIIEMIECHQNL